MRRWPREPIPTVAAALNRSPGACYQAAARLGIRVANHAEYGPEFEAFLREKHAEGWSDADIARDWFGVRETVSDIRRRLGLPCNTHNARHIEKIRAATARQCEDNDVASLGELRSVVFRLRACEAGWPAACTPMMCGILDQLETGPKTRRQLCAAMGKRWHRCKALTTSNGGSAMFALVKMGCVVRGGRVPFAPGKGMTEFQYRLAPGFKRDTKNNLQRESA